MLRAYGKVSISVIDEVLENHSKAETYNRAAVSLVARPPIRPSEYAHTLVAAARFSFSFSHSVGVSGFFGIDMRG